MILSQQNMKRKKNRVKIKGSFLKERASLKPFSVFFLISGACWYLAIFYYILLHFNFFMKLQYAWCEIILVHVLRNIKAEPRPMNICTHILKIKDREF